MWNDHSIALPMIKKELMKLNGKVRAFNKFILKLAQNALPFYKLLEKETIFEMKFGWLTKWSIEMYGFGVSYDSGKALKAQVFADFIAKMIPCILELAHTWKFIYELSNSREIGVVLILENEVDMII